jgi:type IV pilus assembly protein PilO
MKKLTKFHKIVLSILVVLLLVGIALAYFLQIRPLVKEREQLEEDIALEQKFVDAYTNQQKEIEETDISTDSLALQRQLPLNPFYEQIFAIIDAAQKETNSVVETYNFAETVEENVQTEEGTSVEGLNEISLNLSVTAPSYQDMKNFIDYIEKSERIISIDQISFSNPGDEEGNIPFQLSITAYYVEGYDELRESQPTIDIPEPSNKENPLQ